MLVAKQSEEEEIVETGEALPARGCRRLATCCCKAVASCVLRSVGQQDFNRSSALGKFTTVRRGGREGFRRHGLRTREVKIDAVSDSVTGGSLLKDCCFVSYVLYALEPWVDG
ncbi:hypothetical protein KFK09_001233 [Dendrobium nobile]|uniref:Uncharacterized protein n=1 Tax=Dendrobium nobile TaxID=94219 RepID=A0A8T3C9R7_DENNO|nr:hypothetical protein KFK09_001233 [Dendrobium nobile]